MRIILRPHSAAVRITPHPAIHLQPSSPQLENFVTHRLGKIPLVAFALVLLAAGRLSAEVRDWTAADGLQIAAAEFIEFKPGDRVRLRTVDGRDLEIGLAELAAGDQAYVRQHASKPTPPPSPQFNLVRARARRSRTPHEAVAIYRVFLAGRKVPPAERTAAEAELAELLPHAEAGNVRSGGEWVPPDTPSLTRRQADELLAQAFQFVELRQEDRFKQRFAEAAALEPEEIRADFHAGLTFLLMGNPAAAEPYFRRCFARRPDDVAVLNNLALALGQRGNWVEAVSLLCRALDLSVDQRVVHNAGRMVNDANSSSIRVERLLPLRERYDLLVESGVAEPRDPKTGYLYALHEPLSLDVGRFGGVIRHAPKSEGDDRVLDAGSGLVVAADHLLTVASLVRSDGKLEVRTAEGSTLPCQVVASSSELGVALLKCPGLRPVPVSLRDTPAWSGERITKVGYPRRSPRTAPQQNGDHILAPPQPEFADVCLFHAPSDGGLRGGPICDEFGNVVAVQLDPVEGNAYGRGLSVKSVVAFLRRNLPSYQRLPPLLELLSVKVPNRAVAAATVRVLVRGRSTAPIAFLGPDSIETAVCQFCAGRGWFPCDVDGCKRGLVERNGKVGECGDCSGTTARNCNVCRGARYDLTLVRLPAVPDLTNPSGESLTAFLKGRVYYLFLHDKITWSEARTKCAALGGRLACLEDTAENMPIGEAIRLRLGASAEGSGNNNFWIGGTLVDGRWKWISGTPVGTNLVNGRTVTYVAGDGSIRSGVLIPGGADQTCLALRTTTSWFGLRNDETEQIRGYLCEWDTWTP
jgi:tetratricopeptide (TPR) repeat protein